MRVNNERERHPCTRLGGFVFGFLLVGIATPAFSLVWTEPAPVLSLEGRGNVLVASTQGGVLVWDLSSGRAQVLTTERGLPSHVVIATALATTEDELLAATTNGLGLGWLDGAWEQTLSRNDERGIPFFSCLARPASGWIAGGQNGRLASWIRDQVDSLFIPDTRGRVVGLSLVDALQIESARGMVTRGVARLASAPVFPRGLAAGTDNDGLWILLSTGMQTDWRRIGSPEGLPSERTLDLVSDDDSNLWVATTRGVARIAPDLSVESWPSDPLLSQRTGSLLAAPDGFVYLGLQDGLARVDASSPQVRGEPLAGPVGPIVGLAWTREGLCWSNGYDVQSLAGRRFEIPETLARSSCTTLLVEPDTIWVGHLGQGIGKGTLSQKTRDHWVQFGTEDGLPDANMLSLLRVAGVLQAGTAQGLYREERLGTGPCFVLDEQAPFGEVRAQVLHAGRHWIGGSFGLWTSRTSGWQHFDLWPGASEVQDLEAAAETLWVAGGRGGAAFHDGSRWFALLGSGALEAAHFERVVHSPSGTVFFGTDRGVAQWSAGELRLTPNAPDAFTNTICALEDRVIAGTHTGAWIEQPASAWVHWGVLDGLPGARVFDLQAGAEGSLWIATTRGLGWLPPGVLPTPHFASGQRRSPTRVLELRRGDASGKVVIEIAPRLSTGGHVELLDVAGRCVNRWCVSSDTQTTIWNGQDARGRPVASGIYYLRIVDDEGIRLPVQRLTWIR